MGNFLLQIKKRTVKNYNSAFFSFVNRYKSKIIQNFLLHFAKIIKILTEHSAFSHCFILFSTEKFNILYINILGASEVSANLYYNSRTSVLGRLRDYLRLLMGRTLSNTEEEGLHKTLYSLLPDF